MLAAYIVAWVASVAMMSCGWVIPALILAAVAAGIALRCNIKRSSQLRL